ncbi:hypothetical protein BN874_1120006 [Candidatus Contendobacter odensis Run_B_J11]|uniref:NarX-like N-terminal domain-containing protein n=1 Tax=Candidatus Contendobacter odensis Run_B_J11 TaxID=1400861 RepID=A0A7U7J1U8_9GAMM|nr:hypothetical protein BN874_1120006 [Candidatus Contendobacter odensis Run_B_J11]
MEDNESIIFRSGLTMSGIVLLALLSMISSVFIAESSKGDAAAINLAGSLRMQSYRIATRLQQPNSADAYHSPSGRTRNRRVRAPAGSTLADRRNLACGKRPPESDAQSDQFILA